MAVFAISDLHLPFGAGKPMDIFPGWENYTERIKAAWERVVSPEDTVVLPGDFSWAMKLPDTLPDFRYLQSLPGRKILLKGNHDLWWTTARKMADFLAENKVEGVTLLHNSAVELESAAVCGTRGWFVDCGEDRKLLLREAGRLDTSIALAEVTGKPPLVFLHYPPVYGDRVCEEIFSVLQKHAVREVYYGHIHGRAAPGAVASCRGVTLRRVSCDCLDFTPYRIM